ncbi:MAG: phosphonoacetaldehyde reductase [Oscillospiraceae bacterium]|nr:phosphonoacetaldehyde reductase [Oscillospiraceae bacterium]
MQKMMKADAEYTALDSYFAETGTRRILLVCGSSSRSLRIGAYFDALEERTGIRVIPFSEYEPNPEFASAVRGTELFRAAHCDLVAAIGGGSAMDVAKCIKLYAEAEQIDPKTKPAPNGIPLLVIPTTAGTGSEATRFSVIYENGTKLSIADDSILPSAVLFDPDALKTLPSYQRKATMFDALSHAVESCWSVRANAESTAFAHRAIEAVFAHKDGYLANTDAGNAGMLEAANLAGRAINITQTTAGHAMCYKLTKLYGISHGHAAALCNAVLFPHMLTHTDDCTDPRGAEHLQEALAGIAKAMGCDTQEQAAEKFAALLRETGLSAPAVCDPSELGILCGTVNPERLHNHPVRLDAAAIETLYRKILGTEQAV